jgi:hypothetical protein
VLLNQVVTKESTRINIILHIVFNQKLHCLSGFDLDWAVTALVIAELNVNVRHRVACSIEDSAETVLGKDVIASKDEDNKQG